MNKLVDIIIPVHNRPQHTKQTILSLYASCHLDYFNLYVINDKSDEVTTKLLNDLHREFHFQLIENKENIGPGASRNFVCDLITYEMGRSEFLYHSDNDVYFMKDWLPKLTDCYKAFEMSDVKLLGASCHPYLQNNKRLDAYVIDGVFSVGLKDAVSGYSQLMRWDIWDKFGPFDETMRNAEKKIMGSEDWAFCQKIIKAGFKVGSIEPELVVPCGKTNTYGEPATGSETFKEVDGAKVI